jgi:drug/metabolite transporter (DMT)-like permease
LPKPAEVKEAADEARLRQRRLRGLLIAIVGVVLVSTNFVTAKYALRGVRPSTFIPLWFGFVALYCGSYLLIRRPPWLAQVRRNFGALVAMALCNALWSVGFFFGIQWLDPTVTSFLARSGTLYSILLGYLLLGERFRGGSLVGMILVLGGVGAITYSSGGAQLLGIALVLGGYFFGSLNFFFGKRVIETTDAVVVNLLRAMGSIVVALAIALASGGPQIAIEWPYLLAIVLGALFGEFIANVLSFYSMRFIGLSELEILRATQPLFVVIYSVVFLGMMPSLRQSLGGVVVVAGVVLMVLGRSVEQAKHGQRAETVRRSFVPPDEESP